MPSCPECGEYMVRKKSGAGNYFWGCSDFPSCRGSRSISSSSSYSSSRSYSRSRPYWDDDDDDDDDDDYHYGSTPNCPRCGETMVRRKAKKGTHKGDYFWGCSDFPKCWGTIYD